MRVIIAGSRQIKDPALLEEAIRIFLTKYDIIVMVCCKADGPDTMGEDYALAHGIPVDPYPAIWRRPDGSLDRGAGYKRNIEMAKNADALIALWDGTSKGTAHMIAIATKRRLFRVVLNC